MYKLCRFEGFVGFLEVVGNICKTITMLSSRNISFTIRYDDKFSFSSSVLNRKKSDLS